VKPVTWRGTSRGSMSFDASSRSSVVSLVPPSDGIPIRLPTSALGSLRGRSLCDTIASGERQPVNATLVMGAPWSAIAMTDSSQPTHESSRCR